MKRFKLLSFFLLISFTFSGCKKENMCDCIKRTGDIIIEKREVSGFNRVTLRDNLNVYITQGNTFKVEVEAGENIVPLIRTELDGETLVIDNDNRCNWTRSYDKPMNVHITMPILKYILSEGTGKISGTNVITTPLEIETKNSGDIEFTVNNDKCITHMFGYGDVLLHGQTNGHECSAGGDGFLKAADLETGYTYLHSYTSGLCYIYVRDHLILLIDKTGDVYCYGNPGTVEKTLRGSGQLYLH